MSNSPDLLSSTEVAERCRVSRMQVSRWVTAGRLVPAITIGRSRAFRRDDVERLATELREDAIARLPEPAEVAS